VARARDVQEVEISVVLDQLIHHHEQQIALQPIRVVDIGWEREWHIVYR
jgi:hypothetical protein